MIFCALAVTTHADDHVDEHFTRLHAGNTTYTNVTVTSVTAADIYFIHAGGMENVKIQELSPELQQHFHFNSKQARAAEQKLSENKAKYHEQMLQQPEAHPPDMTRDPSAGTSKSLALWRNDFPGALQQAQADKKLVLIDFTGSDWCPWCIKFDQEVLSTGRFADYAEKNLVLLKADFPRHTLQDENLRRNNAALQKTFHVDGFPTYILLNANGDELGRQVGYLAGGPDAFIKELRTFANH